MLRLPHTHSCFVCGDRNPVGLQLKFDADSGKVRALFKPRPEHAGFRDVTHGGVLATVLDEIMVWAIAVQSRQFAYAAELTVRFANPAPPEIVLIASGELVANRKNRLFEAKGELRTDSGILVAACTGKYLPVPKEQLGKLQADLAGDWTAFQDILGAGTGVTSRPP